MTNNTKKDFKIIAVVSAIVFGIFRVFSKNKNSSRSDTAGRIKKGDKVIWEGKKYNVEAVQLNHTKDGQNLYAICRMDPVEDGTKLAVNCLKIVAHEDELQKA